MSDSSRPRPGAPAATPAAATDGEGFLSRWSRRKAQGSGAAVSTAAADASTPPPIDPPRAAPPVAAPSPAEPPVGAAPPAERPALTMADVEQLNAQSDYRAFTAPEVDPEVRNAAMRKLFHSDPHFNVMDGLDVYIDDYNTPQPLSRAIMRTMLQARVLGLIDDELQEQPLPPPDDEPQLSQEGQGHGESGALDEHQDIEAGATHDAHEPDQAPVKRTEDARDEALAGLSTQAGDPQAATPTGAPHPD